MVGILNSELSIILPKRIFPSCRTSSLVRFTNVHQLFFFFFFFFMMYSDPSPNFTQPAPPVTRFVQMIFFSSLFRIYRTPPREVFAKSLFLLFQARCLFTPGASHGMGSSLFDLQLSLSLLQSLPLPPGRGSRTFPFAPRHTFHNGIVRSNLQSFSVNVFSVAPSPSYGQLQMVSDPSLPILNSRVAVTWSTSLPPSSLDS